MNPTTVQQAIDMMFAQVYSLNGMDRWQRMYYGAMHNLVLANAGQLTLPDMLTGPKTGSPFNWSGLVQEALLLLEGLLPTTGIWAELLPVLEAILAGLFPVPTPSAPAS